MAIIMAGFFSPRFEILAGSLGFRLKNEEHVNKTGWNKVFSQHASACGTAFLWSPDNDVAKSLVLSSRNNPNGKEPPYCYLMIKRRCRGSAAH